MTEAWIPGGYRAVPDPLSEAGLGTAQTISQVKLWSGHAPVIGSANWHVRDFDLQISERRGMDDDSRSSR